MIFKIMNGLSHDRAHGALRNMQRRYPGTATKLTRPNDEGVYYAEVVGAAGVAAFRAFLLAEQAAYEEMETLPGGKKIQPANRGDERSVPRSSSPRVIILGDPSTLLDDLFGDLFGKGDDRRR